MSNGNCDQCSALCSSCTAGTLTTYKTCNGCVQNYVFVTNTTWCDVCSRTITYCTACNSLGDSKCDACSVGYYVNAQGTCT